MSIRKIKNELKELRREVESSVAPKVIVSGRGDGWAAGPPVVLARWPGFILMGDARDLKL